MKTLLWLDDIRDPVNDRWILWVDKNVGELKSVRTVWLKNAELFKHWITNNGLPDIICFDHDLGEGLSGYDCAKWLVEYCIDNDCNLPQFAVQSANPVGKKNIETLLNNFIKYKNK